MSYQFTVLVFGTIWTLSTSNVSSRVSKWIARSVLLLIILTCWSRISELEHWPLDVAGGLFMSAAALIVIVSVNLMNIILRILLKVLMI